MKIDLNDLFPQPLFGTKRGPLPKQAEFMRSALNLNDSKYLLYAGGVGSGKSMVGCITMISLAVQYPGDYLISRLYLPELKLTTYKTFLELCPKELILEHRVADGIVRLKTVGGGVSNIIFRGLDEPDKHRSLNLNAAYIDEASQVSEAAFVLLQSRLRGAHVRKILMTTNVAGHDWLYHRYVKQDGLKEEAKKQFKLIHAPSTENIHLPPGYVESMLASWSDDKIQREIYASWDSFSGQVYTEFRRDVHVIQPFVVPTTWTRIIGIDAGFRNAACWLWAAIDYDENVFIYREFYEKEWLVQEIVKGNKKLNKPGVLQLGKGEKIEQARIDPSTKAVRGQTGVSEYETYLEHLPPDFPLMPANNEVAAGIDRVKTFLQIRQPTNKPRLFIFNTCINLIEELTNYRYKELSSNQIGQMNEKEEPVKANDHSCFVKGTLVRTISGPRPIESIVEGDLVLTRQGYQPVLVSGSVGFREVSRYQFTNNQVIVATKDHPVFTNRGKVAINDLTLSDTCVRVNIWHQLRSKALFLEKLGIITGQMARTAKKEWNLFTEKCGKLTMGLSQPAATFTTSTVTPITTELTTYNAATGQNTYLSTLRPQILGLTLKQENNTSKLLGPLPKPGMVLNKDTIGMLKTEKPLRRSTTPLRHTIKNALNAINHLSATLLSHLGLSTAVRIVSKQPLGVAEVFNLTVAGPHEYFVGDILVSNCDALRYLIMSRPEPPKYDTDKLKTIKDPLARALFTDMQKYKKPSQNTQDPFES